MKDLKWIVKFLDEHKLKSISVYDLSSGDEKKYVIIATALSAQTSKTVADLLKAEFNYEEKIEGYNKGEWIVFDLDNYTIHLFLPKIREKYNLDKLYKPKKITAKTQKEEK
ncbi:MAG TPA: ribosome silencing factor [Candidatus Caccovivens faecavium]|nr:ribosome silencing factor [Candidatus Caccovivens faecavium]